jgi:hypothetical protein
VKLPYDGIKVRFLVLLGIYRTCLLLKLDSGEDKVLCRRLGLNLLLDVLVYSFVAMYNLPMYDSNFIKFFLL